MIISCDICGYAFQAKMKSQKRCSSACRKEYRRKWMFERVGDKSWRVVKNCKICNDEFFPKAYNGNMCGKKECINENSRLSMKKSSLKKIKKINNVSCIICGSEFQTIGNSKIISCSKECTVKNRKRTAPNRPYKSKPEFKLHHHLRVMINDRIKGKRIRTAKACDYTIDDLKNHLESQFKDGMDWSNYGLRGWHIDHIRPLSSFDFFNEDGSVNIDEIKSALSLDNLQPLWAIENLKKGAKY